MYMFSDFGTILYLDLCRSCTAPVSYRLQDTPSIDEEEFECRLYGEKIQFLE